MATAKDGGLGPTATRMEGLSEGRWPVALRAYAAGVIDSDGSIGIRLDTYAMRVRKVKAGPVYKERVTLKQIEPQAVDLLHEAFGGSRFISAPQNPRAQPLHSLQIVDRMASTFLEAILPYLLIKRRQAELCIELRRLKDECRKARFAYGRGHRGAGPRPDALTAAMSELRAEIMNLNQVEGRASRSPHTDLAIEANPPLTRDGAHRAAADS
jgi:hypothetical protein